ncbi:predicted protein [Plenodomus lingam JN3]|uniref:Predicted protein n=1 Tax=Leptosphaeria maculans (strain JN3 / isolate v23.1.3 / race Av1-4-5-6-7-8) TaxID=985895 RepID=E5ADG6_LEPMJ|nr:predicted protein [Plenodomus lingam JN3]CBY01255.1 predicted protein [Plenodomus lingam JN3]
MWSTCAMHSPPLHPESKRQVHRPAISTQKSFHGTTCGKRKNSPHQATNSESLPLFLSDDSKRKHSHNNEEDEPFLLGARFPRQLSSVLEVSYSRLWLQLSFVSSSICRTPTPGLCIEANTYKSPMTIFHHIILGRRIVASLKMNVWWQLVGATLLERTLALAESSRQMTDAWHQPIHQGFNMSVQY